MSIASEIAVKMLMESRMHTEARIKSSVMLEFPPNAIKHTGAAMAIMQSRTMIIRLKIERGLCRLELRVWEG